MFDRSLSVKRPDDCDTWNRVENRVLAFGDNNSLFFLLSSSVARLSPATTVHMHEEEELEILNSLNIFSSALLILVLTLTPPFHAC